MGGLLSETSEGDIGGYGLLSDDRKKQLLKEYDDPQFHKQMSDLTIQEAYRPLNYRALAQAGVFRATDGGGKPSEDPSNWSLVTLQNDLHPQGTASWKSKPQAMPELLATLSSPNSGILYNGKYDQLLWSARRLGMRPEEIFLPTNGFATAGAY